MTNWMSISDVPPIGRPLLCYCPDWSDLGYQVAEYKSGRFDYADAPNDSFDDCVEQWALFMEAD